MAGEIQKRERGLQSSCCNVEYGFFESGRGEVSKNVVKYRKLYSNGRDGATSLSLLHLLVQFALVPAVRSIYCSV